MGPGQTHEDRNLPYGSAFQVEEPHHPTVTSSQSRPFRVEHVQYPFEALHIACPVFSFDDMIHYR